MEPLPATSMPTAPSPLPARGAPSSPGRSAGRARGAVSRGEAPASSPAGLLVLGGHTEGRK